MTQQTHTFRGEYTCKVGGEHYQYELEYSGRKVIHWRAHIYQHGELKGNPFGNIYDNTLDGEALRQYLVGDIEGLLEKGLGIAE